MSCSNSIYSALQIRQSTHLIVIRLRRRNRQSFIRAFLDNSVGEHGRGGGAVAGLVRGLARNLAHHLYAHVLELVIELDLLGDGDPVLADAGVMPLQVNVRSARRVDNTCQKSTGSGPCS